MPTTPTKQDGAAERLNKLHADVMNIPCKPTGTDASPVTCYRYGHRDARHAAAELVAEASSALLSEVAALRKALEGIAAVKFSVKEDDSLSYKAAYWEEIALTQQIVAREALEGKQ